MEQFKALTVKNWILFKRNKIASSLQFIFPIAIGFLMIFIRQLADIEYFPEEQFLTNKNLTKEVFGNPFAFNQSLSGPDQKIENSIARGCKNRVIGLAPKGNQYVNDMETILSQFGYNTKTYRDDGQIDEIIRSETYQQKDEKFCFALSFEDNGTDYKYNVRFNVSKKQGPSPKDQSRLIFDIETYRNSLMAGFFQIVTIVNNLILQKATNDSSLVLVNKVSMMSEQERVDDKIFYYLKAACEFLVAFPLMYNFLRQTAVMLQEKQKKIRQSMSICGMKTSIYYATWFLRFFVVYLIDHLIISGIIIGELPHVTYYVSFTLFILFDILLIVQSFFVQIFVTRAKIGIVMALVFYIIQYTLVYSVASYHNMTQQIYSYASIVGHVAFILGFRQLIYVESVKSTADFASVMSKYRIRTAIISLAGNILFWGILGIYLDQVFPNEWGAKKHPLLCLKDYFAKKKEKKSSTKQLNNASASSINKEDVSEQNQNIEPVNERLKELQKANKAIVIQNLKKTFDEGDSYAVDGLSVKMYSDQIFVLLGHNGAGKTTMISMLTGMIQSSEGTIKVKGETRLKQIRSKLGVCPQYDTIYGQLTVQENIRLFASIRGAKGAQLDEEVRNLINDVNLQEKRQQYSKNLSGGQKRRLSVAMAFSGGSQVIILDQPTSGMDTSARRYIWDMLKKYRKDRIIILTTHFMDEADYLGDRIAIMSSGKLAALGSSFFLKNRFGIGYNLTIVKLSNQISSKPISKCIRKHIRKARVLSNVSSQITIQLPLSGIANFPKLFEEIDKEKENFGIQTYGISLTTLQQVFLKVTEQPKASNFTQGCSINRKDTIQGLREEFHAQQNNLLQVPKKDIELQYSNYSQCESKEEVQAETLERQKRACKIFQLHFKATILKRLRVIRRDYKSFIFELILPIVFIILALLLVRISFSIDPPPQLLNFNLYASQPHPFPVYTSSNSNNSALLDSINKKISEKYQNLISPQGKISNSDLQFDKQILFPLKKQNRNIKGGIYYGNIKSQSSFSIIPFTSFGNARSPSTFAIMQTLAVQAYINTLLPKPISINLVNKGLPKTRIELIKNETINGFFIGIIFSLGFAFKFASIVSFIVKEREDKIKFQQIVSGMNVYSYWIGNYVYDFVLYLFVAAFSAGMCHALQVKVLIGPEPFASVLILLFLFGFANIPLTYLLSYLFVGYGNAQAIIYFFNFISGGGFSILILLLRWISPSSNSVARGFAWLLRIIPAYSFSEGLMNIGSIDLLSQVESGRYHAFSLQISLAGIIFLAVFGLIYFCLIFVFQWLQNSQKFMRCFTKQNSYQQINPKTITDSDVIQQQRIALESEPSNFEILTKNIRKIYPLDSKMKYKVAVDNLSFGVKKGEVFGLLGVNGAGKTTTFKILCGQIVSSSGESYFSGLKTSEELKKVRENLGYCPQFDALVENLTVQEQLELFYDMKSLPRQRKDQMIEKKIAQMDLGKYKDKLAGNLSGGNKRKLSVSIAMIGNPRVVFLDEPSTGMDPKTRRFMWKVIEKITKESKESTIILTTHSMEEAEALSTRLGIMVSGNFKCIGTPQHIKSKFGKGFEIQIKVKSATSEEIVSQHLNNKLEIVQINKETLPIFLQSIGASQAIPSISKNGPGNYIYHELDVGRKVSSETIVDFWLTQKRIQNVVSSFRNETGTTQIIEQFQTYIRLKTSETVGVGKLFQFLESNKEKLEITQYGIKQATVEQIFNEFAEEEGRVDE